MRNRRRQHSEHSSLAGSSSAASPCHGRRSRCRNGGDGVGCDRGLPAARQRPQGSRAQLTHRHPRRHLLGRSWDAYLLHRINSLVWPPPEVGDCHGHIETINRLGVPAVDVRRGTDVVDPLHDAEGERRHRRCVANLGRRDARCPRSPPSRPRGRAGRAPLRVCCIVTLRSGRVHDRIGEVPPIHADEVRLGQRPSGSRGPDIEGAPAVGSGVVAPCPRRCRRSPRDRCHRSSGADVSPSRNIFTSPSPYQMPSSRIRMPRVASEEAPRADQAVGDHEIRPQPRRVLAPERDVEVPASGRHGRLQRVVDLVVQDGRAGPIRSRARLRT